MEIVSNVALISINETLVVQLVSFLIFLFIINRVMFRPLRQSMRERERYIEALHQEIVESQKKLDTIARETREEDQAVRKAGLQVTAELEKMGDQEAGEIIAAARQEIARLGEKTRLEIDTQISEASKSIAQEAEQLAVNIMERLLDRRLAS